MYRIRNFGNDRECASLEELAKTLREEYRGHSVSVSYPRPSGFRAIAFIDVDEHGDIRTSYGTSEPVELARVLA